MTKRSDLAYLICVVLSGATLSGCSPLFKLSGLDPSPATSHTQESGIQFGNGMGETRFDEEARAMVSDLNGNIYVGGYSGGRIASDTGTKNAILRKYDSAGNVLWTRQHPSQSYSSFIHMDIDPIQGFLYVAGEDWEVTDGVHDDILIRKYDLNGNLIWDKSIKEPVTIDAGAMKLDPSGNLWILFDGGLDANRDLWVRKYDSDLNLIFDVQEGDPSLNDRVSDIDFDAAGNAWIIGHTTGSVSGGASAGSWDTFLVKYSPTGARLFATGLGTAREDAGKKVRVDSLGNVWLFGTTLGTMPDGGRTGIENRYDVFVAKYANDGTRLFAKNIPATDGLAENVGDMQIDTNDDVWLLGSTSGVITGAAEANAGGEDIFLLKMASDGSISFVKNLGVPGSETPHAMITNTDGSLWICGSASADFGAGYWGARDAFLFQYDLSTGSRTLVRSIASKGYHRAQDIAVTTNVDIYVAGDTRSLIGSGSYNGGLDAFVAKYDRQKNRIWAYTFGSSTDDVAQAIVLDSEENVYVAGYTSGAIGTHIGSVDGFIAKFSFNGNLIWKKNFGGTGTDYVFTLILGPDGNLYAAGHTNTNLGGGHAGSQDAFIAQISPATGDVSRYNNIGTVANDRIYGFATHPSGDLIVTGASSGNLGNGNLGSWDIMLLRYAPASGTVIWKKNLGSSGENYSYSVATDPEGKIYITGGTASDLGYGFTPIPGYPVRDLFVLKLNDDGNTTPIWGLTLGTAAHDEGLKIRYDQGSVYVLGYSKGYHTSDQGEWHGPGASDFLLQKFNSSTGAMTFSKQYTTSSHEIGRAMVLSDGKVFIAGYTKGSLFRQGVSAMDYFIGGYNPLNGEIVSTW